MDKSPERISEKLIESDISTQKASNFKHNVAKTESKAKQYFFQSYIFVLTFFTYAVLHISREGWAFLKDDISKDNYPGIGMSSNQLGTIDMVFLGFYSIGLFISGVLGDNMNKKLLIGVGYILVAASSIMIGMGGIWKIRNVWYYLGFFAISGIVQSVGWPSVVAVMANWFGKSGRGVMFGVWTANPNVGNIIGSVLCNILNSKVGLNWMWTWIIISIIVGVLGIINMLFLVEHPSRVGLVILEDDEGDVDAVVEKVEHEIEELERRSHHSHNNNEGSVNKYESHISANSVIASHHNHKSTIIDDGHEATQSINFFKAWLIPGVIQFSIWYLGLKLANYGIMLWLPKYAHDHLKFNDNEKTLIASLYDIGTIAGSVLLGLLSDWMYGKRSPVWFIGLLLATVGHLVLIFLTKDQKVLLFILIFFLGFLVGGISNIVSGTAWADLGKQDSLKNNSKALGTVTGIVDGTGSVGAAAGQKGIGALQNGGSWTGVFILMTWFVFISSLPLIRIFFNEIKEIRELRIVRKELETKRRSTIKSEELDDDN